MEFKDIKRIFILTGAGVSAESGLKTFRDQDGLWENHSIEKVATPQGFQRDPELVYRFYNQRRSQLLSGEVSPNAAHLALAKLQEKFKGEVTLVTQNVDNLHEMAGAKDVIHMHGSLLEMQCQETGQIFKIEKELDERTVCSCCKAAGNLRPHIVWFGEMPLHMAEIEKKIQSSDLFISIGTSGSVYPAALFVSWVPKGTKKIEVNLNPTHTTKLFDKVYEGPAGLEVPKLVQDILVQ